jgi:hypothetical protein
VRFASLALTIKKQKYGKPALLKIRKLKRKNFKVQFRSKKVEEKIIILGTQRNFFFFLHGIVSKTGTTRKDYFIEQMLKGGYNIALPYTGTTGIFGKILLFRIRDA